MNEHLAFPENVQRRPGMFIGDTDVKGASANLVFELLANATDEHLAGHATEIVVTVTPDEAEVRDNGRGLRFDIASSAGADVFTEMHATGTRDGHSPHAHLTSELRGVGLAVVCALSETVVAEASIGGRCERRSYAMGRASGPPEHRLLDFLQHMAARSAPDVFSPRP